MFYWSKLLGPSKIDLKCPKNGILCKFWNYPLDDATLFTL